ncbi:MAG TPA: TAXI family TRAP transporter solute-binding subunit [Azospirillaceae bacterium]|nr:TAXI family TRAP transporter solute-binding subunit [Azospirillaceae bacterium]
MVSRRTLLGAAAALPAAALPASAQTQEKTPDAKAPAAAAPVARTLTMGTGGVTGLFYPAGGALCRLVNAGRAEHGLRCAVEATDGSVANLNALRAGELDLAIVQSDWQFYAWKAVGRFAAAGPFTTLRSLFSLHADALTILARADTGIDDLRKLARRRLNLGPQGSGPRALFELVMDRMGWKTSSFTAGVELPPDQQGAALCAGQLEAVYYTVAHPNGAVQATMAGCDAALVPVAGPEIDALLTERPYLVRTSIPGGLYGAGDATPTIGVAATLVTTEALPEEAAYRITRAALQDFEALKSQHPALADLTREAMAKQGLSAPLHPGAERYLREAGLI